MSETYTLFGQSFRRPEAIPTLFIIAAIAALCTLGTWQVQRLEWKEGLVARIAEAQALPPLTELPADREALSALEFRRVSLPVAYFSTLAPIHLVGSHMGTNGYYYVVPVLTGHNLVVPVNTGFVPHSTDPATVELPLGASRVEGILRRPREKRYFSPENDIAKNIWFYEDLQALRAYWDKDAYWQDGGAYMLSPLIIELTQKPAGQESTYPLPSDGNITLRNDHLGYAVTWFSIALIGLVMFIAYHRVPTEKAL